MKRLLAVGFVTLALAACNKQEAPQGADGAAPSGSTGTAAAPAADAIKINAEDLVKEFQADKAAAAAKYKDKTLQITGILQDPAGGNVHHDCATLRGAIDPKPATPGDTVINDMGGNFRIELLMSRDQIKPASVLTKGQEVTFQGVCSGFYDVVGPVITCTGAKVIGKGDDPAIIMTAADLAKAFIDDPDATDKKYDGKQIRIQGPVASLSEKDYAILVQVPGEGDKAVKVTCRMGGEGWNDGAKDLKPGQTIKVQGTVHFYPQSRFHEGNEISFSDTTRLLEVK